MGFHKLFRVILMYCWQKLLHGLNNKPNHTLWHKVFHIFNNILMLMLFMRNVHNSNIIWYVPCLTFHLWLLTIFGGSYIKWSRHVVVVTLFYHLVLQLLLFEMLFLVAWFWTTDPTPEHCAVPWHSRVLL